ncbi:unnamed protein product [Calypogeia fissa]
MEFWGTEVTPGKPQVIQPGDDTYVHVSQAALGPSKDGKSERVVVRVESGGKKFVLGTLSTGKVDQMTLDLIFDREFKLSHTSTSVSVFLCGYRTDKRQEYDDESDEEGIRFESDEDEDEEEDDDEEDDEPVPQAVAIKENGTVSAKEGAKAAKKQSKVIEQVVEAKAKKAPQPPKASLIDEEAEEGEDDDEDDDEDADKPMTMDFDLDEYDEDDDSEFEVDDMMGSEGESEEDDEDESDEEEDSDEDDEDEDDVAPELGKKRALQESAKKTPVEGKKARLDTPAKPGLITSGKKGAKGAAETKVTPVSSKKSEAKGAVAKTPQKTPGKETAVKTPKSDKSTGSGGGESAKKLGAHHCAECNRNFASESALSQHAVAKHKK